MFLDDALDGRQPHPRAFEIFRTVQALKHAEEFVGILHVEADPVIAHEYHRNSVLIFLSDFNYRQAARAGELDRIRQQVLKHLLHQRRIALHEGKRADLPLQLASLTFGCQVG